MAYLLSSHYVEPAVWQGVLELHNKKQSYTTESLMELLYTAYRDTTTMLDKIEKFMKVKQTHPLVTVYTKEKIEAYYKAYGEGANLDDPTFVTSWRTNIHPMIAEKLDYVINKAIQREEDCSFAFLQDQAGNLELKYINRPRYANSFRSNSNAAQGSRDGGNSNSSNRNQRNNDQRVC